MAWKVLSFVFSFRAATAITLLPARIVFDMHSIVAASGEQIGNHNLDSAARSLDPGFLTGHVPYRVRQRRCFTELDRGPACVLERLPEALPRLVSGSAISGEQRARENQLQSDQ